MNIYLFDNNRIITFSLPAKRIGDFWLRDSQNNNMVNISAQDGNWILAPSKHTKVYDAAGNTENIILKIMYLIKNLIILILIDMDYQTFLKLQNS